MRGYFGIGVERLSKPMNAGNLFRSARALGACFLFTVAGQYRQRQAHSDTSRSIHQIPFYNFTNVESLMLPEHCQLIGIELIDSPVDLPTFKHPIRAAYVLGPERGNLSPEIIQRCNHLIKIPTSFCINVATASAIVMYDRLISFGRFGQRATFSRNTGEPPIPHIQGPQLFRKNK